MMTGNFSVDFLGESATWTHYISLVFIYLCLWAAIRLSKPRIETHERRTFLYLLLVWGFLMFGGNYLFFKLGFMSFLPWLNNFLHTFVWIGVCLTWLYMATKHLLFWERFLSFAALSLIAKAFEAGEIPHSWSMDHFFFIPGHAAYLLGWSLVDGLYPFLTEKVVIPMLRKLDMRIE